MPKTVVNRVPATVPFHSDAAEVTIGKLARAAEVGVETVRYYQRRRLLAVPHSAGGTRRAAPPSAARRWAPRCWRSRCRCMGLLPPQKVRLRVTCEFKIAVSSECRSLDSLQAHDTGRIVSPARPRRYYRAYGKPSDVRRGQ